MQILPYTWKTKTVADNGTFEGYASVFNTVDLQGDSVAPGAFKAAEAAQPEAGYPLLLNHDQSKLVGGVKIAERPTGLFVTGTVDTTDELGRSTLHKMKQKWLRGMSIGYLIDAGGAEMREGIRVLKSLRLLEISLTPVPANPLALVSGVKSLDEAAALVVSLAQGSLDDPDTRRELDRLTKSIDRLTGKGTADEVDPAVLADLKAIAAMF